MGIETVDVCLVTKSDISSSWERRLRYIPYNRLIIDRSSPLGQARARAIGKVETEWFVFIDDDVCVTRSWFSQIRTCVNPKVGAVQGAMWNVGLGRWNKIGEKPSRPFKLKFGDRGMTHNTLIRTSLVQDWKPSRPNLSSWEDYEITQHILRKGYDWIVCPVDAYHVKSFIEKWKTVKWGIQGWKKIFKPSTFDLGKKLLYHIAGIPYMCLKLSLTKDWWQIPYWTYVNLAYANGVLSDS